MIHRSSRRSQRHADAPSANYSVKPHGMVGPPNLSGRRREEGSRHHHIERTRKEALTAVLSMLRVTSLTVSRGMSPLVFQDLMQSRGLGQSDYDLNNVISLAS